MNTSSLAWTDSVLDVPGLRLGHAQMAHRPTGCTVVLCPEGAVAGVDVRGAAPGTRETDLLAPGQLVERVHAVLLAGGSAFGLDAAGGVMRWLAARGLGLPTAHGVVPIVPAAVLYDLSVMRPGDDPLVRPDADCGAAACEAAWTASHARPSSGSVGAGSGATVGKLFGRHLAMKGGIGHASLQVGPWVVAAVIACNAVGDVLDPATGAIVAGARDPKHGWRHSTQALLTDMPTQTPLAGTNTTVGVLATNARLDKAQAQRLALQGHDGLARSIWPAHTALDGDTLFALATGSETRAPDLLMLGVMAAQATALACIDAVRHAQGLATVDGWLPGAADRR